MFSNRSVKAASKHSRPSFLWRRVCRGIGFIFKKTLETEMHVPAELRLAPAGFRHVSRGARHSVFPATPSRIHAVRRAVEDGFDLPDLAFLDLEHFGELPSPRIRRTAGHSASARRLERAVAAQSMIEKRRS